MGKEKRILNSGLYEVCMNNNNEINLGLFTTTDGKKYHCSFYPEEKRASAIGAYMEGKTSARHQNVPAESEEEARNELKKLLGKGIWSKE